MTHRKIMWEIKDVFLRDSSLLQESLQGEFWIDDSGTAMFADGDVGDMGHAAYVMDKIAREVLDMFGVYCDDEYCNLEEHMDDIYESIKDELSDDQRERWMDGEENVVMAEYLGLNDNALEEFTLKVKILNDPNEDPREYSIKKDGWMRVVQNNVQIWSISPHVMKTMEEGLWDAYGSELDDVDDLPIGKQPTFNIEVLSTQTVYEDVPFGVIASNSPTKLLPYRNKYGR